MRLITRTFSTVVGPASWTRRQLLVTDPGGTVVGWVLVHDRAAGRTEVEVIVAPGTPHEDRLAAALLHRFPRLGQLDLLDALVGDQEGDLLSVE